MTGKEYRLRRIFRPDTGNTVILPVDHGLGLGHIPELRRPVDVIQRMVQTGIDGVLVANGTFSNYRGALFSGRTAPTRIVTADIFFTSANSISQGLLIEPEEAILKGYDGIKAVLIWDQPVEDRIKNIGMLAKLISAAQKCELPVMVEPLLMRAHDILGPIEQQTLSDAVRVAYELGADILKVPYPNDDALLANWVGDFTVPLVLLGGGNSRTVKDIKSMVSVAMEAGVKGIVMGRNIWNRAEQESVKLMEELVEIVHGKSN